jgi:hypothetical protein
MISCDLRPGRFRETEIPHRLPRVFSLLGVVWVCLGLIVNEWTLPIVLGIEPLGPRSLMLVRTLNLTAICWGICTVRWHSNGMVQSLNLFFCVTIVTLVLAEGTLRMFPAILGEEFATGVLTKYHTRTGGIYYFDPVLRMGFMEPNRTEKMYYNGHTWLHRTDQFGFRNYRTVNNADVVLLGDSFIYGHGVDIEQTVGYFIENIGGYTVFNLAQQGDCSLQQAYRLTEYMQKFSSPKHVLYFFFDNDIDDLYAYRTDDELLEFINTPLAEIRYKPRADTSAALKARDESNYFETHVGPLFNLLKRRIYLLKILDWIQFTQNRRQAVPRPEDERRNVNNDQSIGWRYTKKAILYMNYISQNHGSRLFIVPIIRSNKEHFAILENFAREQNIDIVDTRVIYEAKGPHLIGADRSLFLRNDGHFSEKGARTMAEIVLKYIEPRL